MSDTDQTLADREQHASDRDQAAADWEDDTHSSDISSSHAAHETSRIERDAVRRERASTAADRSKTTAQRLATAALRDEAARLAGLRALREASAASRHRAASERQAAAADREGAAADRRHAATGRRLDGLDELTGVFRRGTGELALTHEIDRSRRAGHMLVLALIDVDALKAVNDNQGHAAGDALLCDVATAIITTLRSYDVTVRWGGDEFVCAMSNVTQEVAVDRLAAVQRTLQTRHPRASISSGSSTLRDGDTLHALIARADAALYRGKTTCDP